MKRRGVRKSFTLIELLIVISIISMVFGFIIVSVRNAQSRARDTRRMTDLSALNDAINMYYRETGHYPSLPHNDTVFPATGCGNQHTFDDGTVSWINEDSSSNVTVWQSGNCLANDFIPGLVPKYINKLPIDPGPNYSASGSNNDRGYIYIHKVLTTGTTRIECYKIMSHQPENPAIASTKRIWDPQRDGGANTPEGKSIVDGTTPWAWSYYSRGCAFDKGGSP